jgi:hypothetical protein
LGNANAILTINALLLLIEIIPSSSLFLGTFLPTGHIKINIGYWFLKIIFNIIKARILTLNIFCFVAQLILKTQILAWWI